MEEILNQVAQEWGYENYETFLDYANGNNLKSFTINAMKKYAKSKFVDQRYLCANNARLFDLDAGNSVREYIINAPEPEL